MMKKSSKREKSLDPRRANKKALRGIPIFYNQVKKKYTVTLTPELNEKITEEAKNINTSKSELIEIVFRERYDMAIPSTEEED